MPNLFENNNEYKTVFMSKKDKINELIQKIIRSFKFYYMKNEIFEKINERTKIKIYKLSENFDLEGLKKNFNARKKNEQLKIKNLKLLNETFTLEDCEIAENDILLVEIQIENNWIFINDDIIIYKCNNCGCSSPNLLFCQCKTVNIKLN